MRAASILLVCATLGGVAHADDTTAMARGLLDELVATDTSNPPGNEDKAARLIAAKLRAAGIEPTLVPFAPGRANVVARLKGDGTKKPLLLLAHLDVVGAAGQPWTTPPFRVSEKDGWLYGRGVTDDKSWVAMATALVIELKKTHAPLHRDVIVAFTGDEESGGAGIRYLLEHRKALIGDAEYALNEGGGVHARRQGQAAPGQPRHRREDLPGLRAERARRRRPLVGAERRQRDLSADARARQGRGVQVPDASYARGARQLARQRGHAARGARQGDARRGRRQGRLHPARAARGPGRASVGARDDAHHLRDDDDLRAARATTRCRSRPRRW